MYRPGVQQVHITQGPIVMSAPGQLTASTQVRNDIEGQPSVTTSVVMSPPDYNIATQLPRYSSGSSRGKVCCWPTLYIDHYDGHCVLVTLFVHLLV